MYPIKFVVLFPDKNELIGSIYYLLYFLLHHIFVPVHIFSEVIKNPALWLYAGLLSGTDEIILHLFFVRANHSKYLTFMISAWLRF